MAAENCISDTLERLAMERDIWEIVSIASTMLHLTHDVTSHGALATTVEAMSQKIGAIGDGLLDRLGYGRLHGNFEEWRKVNGPAALDTPPSVNVG